MIPLCHLWEGCGSLSFWSHFLPRLKGIKGSKGLWYSLTFNMQTSCTQQINLSTEEINRQMLKLIILSHYNTSPIIAYVFKYFILKALFISLIFPKCARSYFHSLGIKVCCTFHERKTEVKGEIYLKWGTDLDKVNVWEFIENPLWRWQGVA